MNLLRKILFPIVPVYYVVTWLRNKLYEWGIKPSKTFNLPIICVGNLSVGGTGKTPMIEYLIMLMKDQYKVATLSRGYKRKTEGFQIANTQSSAEDIGDEPFQFYHKFGNSIQVSVDSNRVNGVSNLLELKNNLEIVLLDDAFQHRKIKAGFNILLTTYENPFFNDIVLPTGNLREPKRGYKRADIIVVTKCPKTISDKKKKTYIKRIQPEEGQYVFFSSITYADVVISSTKKQPLHALNNFTLVTGIAKAAYLVDFLNSKQLNFEHLNYKDHHEFSSKDINLLESKTLILTTEKDFMRLKQYDSLKTKLFYLPITLFISENKKFDALIERFISSY